MIDKVSITVTQPKSPENDSPFCVFWTLTGLERTTSKSLPGILSIFLYCAETIPLPFTCSTLFLKLEYVSPVQRSLPRSFINWVTLGWKGFRVGSWQAVLESSLYSTSNIFGGILWCLGFKTRLAWYTKINDPVLKIPNIASTLPRKALRKLIEWQSERVFLPTIPAMPNNYPIFQHSKLNSTTRPENRHSHALIADTLNCLDNASAGCTAGYTRCGHTSDFTHGKMAVARLRYKYPDIFQDI